MISRSTTSRIRSSIDTDAAGRAVDAWQPPPPRISRGMQAAVAALLPLMLLGCLLASV
jgi:hypothetical protein